MSQMTFNIKQNDRRPYLKVTFFDSTGSAMNLTGETVVFNMRNQTDKALKINRAAAVVTSAINGEVEYRWQPGDTDTIGRFDANFETTNGSGEPLTLPQEEDAYIEVIIGDDIA